MARDVAVMTLTADDKKTIMVVVCLSPAPTPAECYANKDGKHAGWVKVGQFIQTEKDEPLTDNERGKVVRAFYALRGALGTL